MVKNKTVCFIFAYGKFHELLALKAAESFKYFHKDIDVEIINEEKFKQFKLSSLKEGNYNMPMALLKQAAAYEYMTTHDYDKLIFLGADTLTCGRLDEFLDNNRSEIVVTACFPYQISCIDNTEISLFIDCYHQNNGDNVPMFNTLVLIQDKITGDLLLTDVYVKCIDLQRFTVVDYYLANPDVVCYNSPAPLKTQIDFYFKFFFSFVEFGSLNYAIKEHSFEFADLKPTFFESDVVYNSRAKVDNTGIGVPGFKVNDNKLYDSNGKQIKVYHMQEQFTKFFGDTFEEQKKAYNKIMTAKLNTETVKFFNNIGIDVLNL